MPFTPLVPLPDAKGGEMLDPFEELLRPSAASSSTSSSSKPIFPAQSSVTRRSSAQPIPIPTSSASTTTSGDDMVNRGSNASLPFATPASANSDFGAFVSVDPSQDPLSADFSPITEFVSPPSQTLGGANDAFVEEARRRAEHGEKRIRDEFTLFEQDPSSLIAGSTPARPVVAESFLSPDAKQQLTDFEEAFEDMDMFDPLRTSSSDTNQPKDSTPSITSSSSIITSDSKDARSTTPTTASTPDVFHSRTSTPTLEDSAPVHDSATSPMSSSFTSYFSGTLPRKWSTLLRSPSSSALPVQHPYPHPAHASTMPASIPIPRPISSDSHGSLTHSSPFAAHPFTPPSGAPGFGGDRNWNKGFEFSLDQKVGKPVDLIGRSETARKVLSAMTAETLRPHLPPLFRLAKKWTLLYSLDQHGISLATFYSRVSPHDALGGCLLAVRDAEDRVFGVWMGDGIHKSSSTGAGRGYYGSGESFLWKQESDEAPVHVFKWTGKNDYVALCEPEYISFGGGDGKYGLFLDSSLYDGSDPCAHAYVDNEPLSGPTGAAGTVRFECVGLEAWGIPR